ncbi:MAG TPA: GtrA family protein [Ktedonobacteraceae bacterium]|jgi:putative flippase GtrA
MEQSSVKDNASELEMQKSPMSCRPSYTPTSWAMVNRALDIVDNVTNGRADWVQRFFSYSFIGGIAAVVNLLIFSILAYPYITSPANDTVHTLIARLIAFIYHYTGMSVGDVVHTLIAQLIAFEISLMVNFIPNDYFTFRHLAGHSRSWGARFLRYHITSITGFCLTSLIQFAFAHGAHMIPFFSQAIALILVFIYNFTFHHLFTYRRVSHAPKQSTTRVDIHKHMTTEESSVDEDTSKIANSSHVSANSATPL